MSADGQPASKSAQGEQDDGQQSRLQAMQAQEPRDEKQRPPDGKENQREPKFCFECNRSLAKSRHLIHLAGQEHRWHPECFRCNVCLHPLDRETSCHFFRDKIVCREDYAKLRRDCSIKCSRCNWPIGASDWVRWAGRHVYHLACFSCDICLRQLSTGEQFAINSVQERNLVRLLCRLHFAVEGPSSENAGSLGHPEPASSQQRNSRLQNDSPGPYDFSASLEHRAHLHLGPAKQVSVAQESCSTKPLDLAADPTAGLLHLQTGGQLDDQPRADLISGSSSSASSAAGILVNSNLQSKSKRVRTTFTEDQLAILQTHFQHDSNPDGSDLERIATITGLSKRVTQVWFQNSRARQKKYMIKRKPAGSASVLVAPLQQPASSGQFAAHQNQSPAGSSQHHDQQLHRQLADQVRRLDSARRKWSNLSEPSNLSIDSREDEDEDFDDSSHSSVALMMMSEDSSD